jgi:hypothetical protein
MFQKVLSFFKRIYFLGAEIKNIGSCLLYTSPVWKKTHFSWSQVAKEQESAKDPREKEKVGDETVPNDFTTYVLRPEK